MAYQSTPSKIAQCPQFLIYPIKVLFQRLSTKRSPQTDIPISSTFFHSLVMKCAKTEKNYLRFLEQAQLLLEFQYERTLIKCFWFVIFYYRWLVHSQSTIPYKVYSDEKLQNRSNRQDIILLIFYRSLNNFIYKLLCI